MGNIMLITIEQLLHKSNVLCAAIQSNSVGNYQEAARQLEALRASVPMKFISEKIWHRTIDWDILNTSALTPTT